MSVAYDRETMTIHLQSYGRHPAVYAETLEIGDVTVWNGGGTSTVKSITPRGKTQLLVVETSDHDGQDYERIMRRDRLVAARRALAPEVRERIERIEAAIARVAEARNTATPAPAEAVVIAQPAAEVEPATPARRGERFTVRQQRSGYNGNRTWFVYDRQRKGRTSVHAHTTRDSAVARAGELNKTLGWDEPTATPVAPAEPAAEPQAWASTCTGIWHRTVSAEPTFTREEKSQCGVNFRPVNVSDGFPSYAPREHAACTRCERITAKQAAPAPAPAATAEPAAAAPAQRPTPAQQRLLDDLAAGRGTVYSERRVRVACREAGWIKQVAGIEYELTDAGRAMAAEAPLTAAEQARQDALAALVERAQRGETIQVTTATAEPAPYGQPTPLPEDTDLPVTVDQDTTDSIRIRVTGQGLSTRVGLNGRTVREAATEALAAQGYRVTTALRPLSRLVFVGRVQPHPDRCETCVRGCDCEGGTPGCEHATCVGDVPADLADTCPGVKALDELTAPLLQPA